MEQPATSDNKKSPERPQYAEHSFPRESARTPSLSFEHPGRCDQWDCGQQKNVSLPAVASKVPESGCGRGVKVESRVKRLKRWSRNKTVESEIFFRPFAEALFQSLRQRALVLAMDGSIVGRGCMALMVGVVCKQRALPGAWIVAGRRGRFPERIHLELMSEVRVLIPDGAGVLVLGDGEFTGVDLQALAKESGWGNALRASKTSALTWQGEEFQFTDVADHMAPGDVFDVPGVLFAKRRYGPVRVATWWRRDCKGPIHLVANMTSAEEACGWYGKRFKAEPLFSDQKSRAFHLHKSHLSDPGASVPGSGRLLSCPPLNRPAGSVRSRAQVGPDYPSHRAVRSQPLSSWFGVARSFSQRRTAPSGAFRVFRSLSQ